MTPRAGKLARQDVRWTRSAFTLVELLVSLAVLTIALATVARVFTITSQAATQAAAYSEAQNWVRQFTFELKEDLRHIVPSESVLVIRGRKLPAALTPEDLEAGLYYRELVGSPTGIIASEDPRRDRGNPHTAGPNLGEPTQYSDPCADLMMFITNRAQASQAPLRNLSTTPGTPEFAMQTGAKFSPMLVVYGHGALADAVSDGTRFVPAPASSWRHIATTNRLNQSVVPAQEWYLARRATLLIDDPNASLRTIASGAWYEDNLPAGSSLLCGLPGNNVSGGNSVVAGDAAVLRLRAGRNEQNILSEFGLLDAFDPPAGAPAFLPDPAMVSPYGRFNAPPSFRGPDFQNLLTLMYPNVAQNNVDSTQLVATIIRNPPADLKENLGLHALPGCAWFQVEILMPEDPRSNLGYRDPSPENVNVGANSFDPPRWRDVAPGSTYIFVPDSPRNRQRVALQPGNTGGFPTRGYLAFGSMPDPVDPQNRFRDPSDPAYKPIRMWPYGIRVTVRVFDPQGRLDQPLVRTIVHRFD
ncbi:MAG: type II secretion system protein J [Phycisphaerae bacterium]